MSAGGPLPRLQALPEPHLPPAPPSPAPLAPPDQLPGGVGGSGAPVTPAMQQAQEAQKEKEWYEKRQKEFAAVFLAAQNWKLENDPQKDKKFIFKNTVSGLGAVIEVLPNKGISLSGDATNEIAHAAMSYFNAENNDQNPIKFKVEAQDQAMAHKFIKELGIAGFNLDLINSIVINGNKVAAPSQEFKQFMDAIKAEIIQCRPVPPT